MATTFVDICNAALIRIGLPIIAGFTDGTNRANVCASRYESCRDIVLRMHPWSCATQRVQLASSTTSPAFDYQYQYPMPSDFLRELQVSSSPYMTDCTLASRPRYRIESGNILFDFPILYLLYVQRVTNANQLDSLCQQAMALYLAYDIAQLLLQNENLVGQLNKEFEGAMATARNVNAQENDRCFVIDQFERARLWGPS
jgi:hypothetical protein